MHPPSLLFVNGMEIHIEEKFSIPLHLIFTPQSQTPWVLKESTFSLAINPPEKEQ